MKWIRARGFTRINDYFLPLIALRGLWLRSFGRLQPDVLLSSPARVSMPRLTTLHALLVCASAGWGADLHTLANKNVSGDLVALSDKEITLRSGPKDIKTPVGDVLQLE